MLKWGKLLVVSPFFRTFAPKKRKQYKYNNKKIKSYGKREDDYCSFRHC